jgi:hypothetical protein
MYVPFVLGEEMVAPDAYHDVDLVIFPEFVEGEVGIYRANLVPLKKRLAEDGIRAEYSHPPERRAWLRELSAAEIALNVAIGLVTSGSVAIVQHLVARRDPSSRVKVKITKARKVRGRRMWDAEFVEFEGPADDVARQIEQWKETRDGE